MKKPTGSRALLKKQLVKVLYEAIPRLETLEQSYELESNIYNAYKAGVLSSNDFEEMTYQISVVRIANGWEVSSV